MQKAFKFRAYPNAEQAVAMAELLETHRRLYNNALSDRRHCFEAEKRTLGYGEQSGRLKTTRRENPYLGRANFSSCQRTLKRLDRAFQAFFRRVKAGETPGYPRFRGRGRFDSVEFTQADGARLTSEGKVYFQSVGAVKLKMHRPLEGSVKTITFRRQADGWFVIFLCDVAERAVARAIAPPVGIDLGLKAFLATSAGETVAPPKFYRQAQAKLRRAQRSVARKKKGGANRRKAVQRLARHHQHVRDQRRDFHHKTALDFVTRYGFIAHEALNVKGIARSRLAKSTHDAGWAQFLTILGHKAACAGVSVVAVDPRLTTQTCSECGGLPAVSLTLSVRRYECSHCGLSLDRDVNAARVVLKRAWIGPLGANVEDVALMRSPRSLRL
jgi:putative transposase